MVVQIGDFFTMDSLNTHIPNETFQGRLKGSFLDDIASGGKALQTIAKNIGRNIPKLHCTAGNHERRLYLLADKVPEVAGLMEHEYHRVLQMHGWGLSEYGEIFKVGGVGFVHAAINRLGKTFGGLNTEITIGNQANCDLVIGHSHVSRVHTAPKIGGDFVRVVNLGCALPHGHIEPYAKHSQTGWSWGVWVLRIWDRHIQDYNFVSMKELGRRYG